MKDKIEEILGLKIHGIIHYYNEQKMSISFDDSNINLEFYGCPLAFDSGIVSKIVHIAEEYNGEMGFVLTFKTMKLDADDYKYFIIRCEDGEEHYQNQMRITMVSSLNWSYR